MYLQVFKALEKISGTEHPDTLASMYNLAIRWKEQDRCEKAISLTSDAVKLSKSVLDPEGPDFKNL